LVTGGSRGIGRGIALALAAQGAAVVVNYHRQAEAATRVCAEIEGFGGRAICIGADVSDYAAVCEMREAIAAQFGRLDILVASSGIASRAVPVADLDIEHWRKVLAVDLDGAFYTARAMLPLLFEAPAASAVFISSIAADLCDPCGAAYCAAKAGVNALAKVLARELAPRGIRVNVIAPGLVATDMGERMLAFHGERLVKEIPLGRVGTVEDVAKLAVFLASDDASWITGKIFRVDGGKWI